MEYRIELTGHERYRPWEPITQIPHVVYTDEQYKIKAPQLFAWPRFRTDDDDDARLVKVEFAVYVRCLGEEKRTQIATVTLGTTENEFQPKSYTEG